MTKYPKILAAGPIIGINNTSAAISLICRTENQKNIPSSNANNSVNTRYSEIVPKKK